jgi:hypothetical protein
MSGNHSSVLCPWCGGSVPATVPTVGQSVYLCGTCKNYVGVRPDGSVFRQQPLPELTSAIRQTEVH